MKGEKVNALDPTTSLESSSHLLSYKEPEAQIFFGFSDFEYFGVKKVVEEDLHII